MNYYQLSPINYNALPSESWEYVDTLKTPYGMLYHHYKFSGDLPKKIDGSNPDPSSETEANDWDIYFGAFKPNYLSTKGKAIKIDGKFYAPSGAKLINNTQDKISYIIGTGGIDKYMVGSSKSDNFWIAPNSWLSYDKFINGGKGTDSALVMAKHEDAGNIMTNQLGMIYLESSKNFLYSVETIHFLDHTINVTINPKSTATLGVDLASLTNKGDYHCINGEAKYTLPTKTKSGSGGHSVKSDYFNDLLKSSKIDPDTGSVEKDYGAGIDILILKDKSSDDIQLSTVNVGGKKLASLTQINASNNTLGSTTVIVKNLEYIQLSDIAYDLTGASLKKIAWKSL